MSSSNLSAEEKRQLTNARQSAVRNAWKNEKNLVENGQGTRNWTKAEQKELLQRGSVRGYEGHHMKSVSKYPEHAGNPNNIQFLNEKEHLRAHGGDYHSPTNGYYNPSDGKMYKFKGSELKSVPKVSLNSNSNASKNKNQSNTQKTGKEKSAEFRSSLNNKKNNTGTSRNNSSQGHSNGNKR